MRCCHSVPVRSGRQFQQYTNDDNDDDDSYSDDDDNDGVVGVGREILASKKIFERM